MRRVAIDAQRPDAAVLLDAAAIVKAGGIVAMPTDTLYGLAADPFSIAESTSANPLPIIVDTAGFFAGRMHNHNPVWSQDGQWIYFAHGPQPNDEMNVWRVRPSGGTPEQLTALRVAANHLAVIDQRTVLYAAPAEDGSGPWLWSLDVDTKATRRVISGVEHYSSVSASRDGRRIVASAKVEKVHFIAHSMGNRVMLQALRDLADGDGYMADLGDPAAECGYFASGRTTGGSAGA